MIELVDKLDHQKRNYAMMRHGKQDKASDQLTGGNDLMLQVEGEEGGSQPKGSRNGSYVGMEVDMNDIDPAAYHMSRGNQRKLIAGMAIFLSVLIVIVVMHNRSHHVPSSALHHHHAPTTIGSHRHHPSPSHSHIPPHHNVPPALPHKIHLSHDDDEEDFSKMLTLSPVVPLWPTTAPAPRFTRCPPQFKVPKHKATRELSHIHIVPEDKSDGKWSYSISSMDIDEAASIVAVGISDFGRNTKDKHVGMVRVFGWHCYGTTMGSSRWKQLGQDLLGTRDQEGFGYQVSLSSDGKTMAVSSIQDGDGLDDHKGFVQVYQFKHRMWMPLGYRIENIDVDDVDDYKNLGFAIDLNDGGDHLAVLGIVEDRKFVTRVFVLDGDDWIKKGHDLVFEIDYADGYDFAPDLMLSAKGNALSVADPQFGVLSFSFNAAKNQWIQGISKASEWDEDEIWMESMEMDAQGSLVAYAAFVVNGTNKVRIVDFHNDTNTSTIVYNYTLNDTMASAGVTVAVADEGRAVAFVASKRNMDDDEIKQADSVGALSVIAPNKLGVWESLSGEPIGVTGSLVQMSKNGKLVAVGGNNKVTLYGIAFNHTNITHGDGNIAPEEQSSASVPAAMTEQCKPFEHLKKNGHGHDLDDLPKQKDEHSLSVALSNDGTFLAVGVDSYDGEDRGLARVFRWNCTFSNYTQLGQDLFGPEEFDGFGVSVDLSADGMTMVVGANQPPLGKKGFVVVFDYVAAHNQWRRRGKRIRHLATTVEDVGRVVRISDDGSTVAVAGSVIEGEKRGSFVRVLHFKGGQWVRKGNDIRKTIDKSDPSSFVHIDLSGDGHTLAMTSGNSSFVAAAFYYDSKKNKWVKSTITTPHTINKTAKVDYFIGHDVALNEAGDSMVVGGEWVGNTPAVHLFELVSNTHNWTQAELDTEAQQQFLGSSIAVSNDASRMAIGVASEGEQQGALAVMQRLDNGTWTSVDRVVGRDGNDILGTRVAMSRDGRVSVASSRSGYLSFVVDQNA